VRVGVSNLRAPTSMKVSDLRLVVDWRRYVSASSAMYSRNSSVALEISFTAYRHKTHRHATPAT